MNCTPKLGHNFWRCRFSMSKYSQKTKDQALYLFKIGFGIQSVANQLNISRHTIKNWLFKYKNNSSLSKKMNRRIFSAEFKRKVIETRWQNKLSFKETAELFNIDNPSLIAAWNKKYLDKGFLGLQPKPKGRPPMKTKNEINVQIDSTKKSDKERIKELEAEIARLKYEMSFYDDFMKEMREIAKPNRAVKKKHKQLPSKD